MTALFKLSPSDLTFLWDECPRCFYLKVKLGHNRPRTPMPGIFTKIDALMKGYFQSKTTSDIYGGLPAGVVKFGEKWVQSQPISYPNHLDQCYIRGKFDTVVEFDDGSFGIVDFKTSEPKAHHVAFYGRQLHAYAYALESPAPGKLALRPISRLGLLVVEPNQMLKTQQGHIAYVGEVTWQEIPRDDISFMAFLDKVMSVLEQPMPPPAASECKWCEYRAAARQHGL